MPPKHKLIDIKFPLGGLNRRGAHRQQPPYTSRNLLNVRPKGNLQGRERGGSRPGLIESHFDNLGAAVRLLSPMVLALGDGFTSWSDTFDGTIMSDAWTQASWASDVPSIMPSALAGVDTSVAEGEVVRDPLPIDTAKAYTVEMFLTPWGGTFSGKYRIYLRLDDAAPDYTDAGVMVELFLTSGEETGAGKIVSVTGGVETSRTFTFPIDEFSIPGWFSVTVVADDVTVYWNGVEEYTWGVDAHPGAGVGFGLQTIEDGDVTLVNTFRVQYYSTGTTDALRSMLVASAGGDLWRESTYGRMTVVASDLTVRDDILLRSVQSGQKLYIADYGDTRDAGTDGTVSGSVLDDDAGQDWSTLGIDPDSDVCVILNVGPGMVAGTYKITEPAHAVNGITLDSAPGDGACAYRIERAPKIYDPLLNTITIMTATAGQVPTGNPLICRYLDRIVVAGAEIAPHVWYMSRQGDPLDWDYSQEDSRRAVAGTASEAGVPGTAITALIPHSDDYLIMGCRSEIWRLRGDPAFGGQLDSLSHAVGIIGRNAWCLGPAGELIFLSLDGIYVLAPGGNSYPESMSRETLPREFLNLDPNMVIASLEYDVTGRGVHIYLTPDSSNARMHWWLDWDRKTFWPVSMDSDHEPTATCAVQGVTIEDSGVILGGRDGTLRRLSDLADVDSRIPFATYAEIGPIALGRDGETGSIVTMSGEIAIGSGDVTWATHPAQTFEGTETVAASDTGTFIAGLNASVYPACRGQAVMIKLTGEVGRGWSIEQVIATVRPTGRRRIS